ncbi:MAG: heme-binding protein [Acidimicrobiia bacterium]|nr:heme-binding protein [Acidimicrobiia bacterium]
MSSYEQPRYSVVATAGAYEIRLYESYLAAETTVSGDVDSTGNTAFRRLAGFIFGRNAEGIRMNMTVPVTRQETNARTYRYRFVMESAYSESQLPRPLDDSVEIVRVPAGYYAAMRYRGGRNEGTYKRMEGRLLEALQRDGVATLGDPTNAVYDGPMKPPMLRRNEVLVPVAWQESSSVTAG